MNKFIIKDITLFLLLPSVPR